MNKKGITPLIATVLILGATLVVAVVAITFFSNLVDREVEGAEIKKEVADLCIEEIKLEFDIICNLGPYLRLRIDNEGNYPIERFLSRITSNGEVVTTGLSNLSSFSSGVFYPRFSSIPENIEKIRVSPVISYNGKQESCPEFRVDLENIPLCSSYVINPGGETLFNFDPNTFNWQLPYHEDAVLPDKWESGYILYLPPNDPSLGYHAKWVKGEGYDGSVGVKMLDNSYDEASGTWNRWIGINQEVYPVISSDLGWQVGDNITISVYARTNHSKKDVFFGFWTSVGWGHLESEGIHKMRNVDEWDIYSFSFDVESYWDLNSWGRIVLLGMSPRDNLPEPSVIRYDNIQMFKTPS